MAITLCVLLWARPGADDALTAYEDEVLRLVPAHGGTVVSRVRRLADGTSAAPGPGEPGAGEPLEVQVISMPDGAALDAYTNDPARLALSAARDAAVARTVVIPVRPLACLKCLSGAVRPFLSMSRIRPCGCDWLSVAQKQ
jgi:hypothetical protein